MWTLIGIAVTGLALSMALTKDTHWTQWHLSRLGEGQQFAAAIFNYSLIAAAMILVLITVRITDEIHQRHPKQSIFVLRTAFLLVAAGWVGVATFPFDRFPTIHNIFGYGQMAIVCFLMLRLKHLSRGFSDRTHAIGLAGAIAGGSLMAMFHLVHTPSLLVVELCGQIILFAWLLSMTRDQRLQAA